MSFLIFTLIQSVLAPLQDVLHSEFWYSFNLRLKELTVETEAGNVSSSVFIYQEN